MHRSTSSLLVWPALLIFSLVLSVSSCLPDQELFPVDCASFDTSLENYAPFSVGDTLVFSAAENDSLLRRFPVVRRFELADTTYTSLNEGERCVPFVEYYLTEVDANRTAIFYFINDLSETNGAGSFSIGINFADAISSGLPYFQQFIVRPMLRGQINTSVTALDSLAVNGVSYPSVIRAELINSVPEAGSYFNNVRRIWVAPDAGIIQFEDDRSGLWGLRRD